MFGWGENMDNEKQREENMMKNNIFHRLIQERKQERQIMVFKKILTPGQLDVD